MNFFDKIKSELEEQSKHFICPACKQLDTVEDIIVPGGTSARSCTTCGWMSTEQVFKSDPTKPLAVHTRVGPGVVSTIRYTDHERTAYNRGLKLKSWISRIHDELPSQPLRDKVFHLA